jgi:hypothetical protein
MLSPDLAENARPWNEPVTRHYDLTVHGAREQWRQIRWALFVFPDITDVAPTDDAQVVRVFYEGNRPYPCVWRVELRQQGFGVPTLDARDVSAHGVPVTPSATRARLRRAPRRAGSDRRSP